MRPSSSPTRVALAGAIGRKLGQALMARVPGYDQTSVAVTDAKQAQDALRGSTARTCALEELADHCDIANRPGGRTTEPSGAFPSVDATTVEIWAHPGITRNIHELKMVAGSVTLKVLHLLRKRRLTLVVRA